MATPRNLQLVVITPERLVLEVEADSVVIPAHDGELGILRNRAPIMCELATGRLRYRSGSTRGECVLDGGFAQVLHNRVIVLAEGAVKPDEVTPELIAQAERRAGELTSPAARTRARRFAALLRTSSN